MASTYKYAQCHNPEDNSVNKFNENSLKPISLLQYRNACVGSLAESVLQQLMTFWTYSYSHTFLIEYIQWD